MLYFTRTAVLTQISVFDGYWFDASHFYKMKFSQHIYIPDICRRYGKIWKFSTSVMVEMSDFSTWQMWRNLKLSTSGICVMWRNFRFLHISVQFMVFCCILCYFFLQKSFFCKLRCFVAKSVLSRNPFCRNLPAF